jgi:hypothetical protein
MTLTEDEPATQPVLANATSFREKSLLPALHVFFPEVDRITKTLNPDAEVSFVLRLHEKCGMHAVG